ncbi:hypothetical protein Glove_396g26 [Diversispora epigaea]|uniref:SAM domain-containing protein n=1 Tax=Diversispora epigaea TaxID=1348612 RepID=A0A397H2E4_9GLOM|nr:hypothetical protein Glove_396g26 [Diversispora epigaea]
MCNCDLTKKPSRTSANIDRSKRGHQVYNRHVTSTIHSAQLTFLQEANTKFEYGSNFSIDFDISLCVACNSKYERSKKIKIIQTDIQRTSQKDNDIQHTSQKDNDDNDKMSFPITINIQVIIRRNNENLSGKWIKINLIDYMEFCDYLTNYIQKTLEGSFISKNNFIITYKINGRGQAMALDDNNDFIAFIQKYKDISGSKNMVLYININDKSKRNSDLNYNKQKSVKINSSDNEIERRSYRKKKLKKSRIPKESQLDKTEMEQAQIITEIRTKYNCNVHTTPCYIEDGRHLQLTPTRLTLWARDIIRGITTIDVPPSYPTFGAMHAKPIVLTSNNTNNTSTIPISSSMPQWFMPFPFPFHGTNIYPSIEKSTSNLSELSKYPTITEFLQELDNIHNDNGTYLQLESKFIDEDITVNAIKDLTNEELITLGVTKIGWRKNIIQAANKY